MGLNISELVLVAVIVFLVIGIGQIPMFAEAVGRMRQGKTAGALEPVDITPDAGPAASVPGPLDEASIQGPMEDAELIESDPDSGDAKGPA